MTTNPQDRKRKKHQFSTVKLTTRELFPTFIPEEFKDVDLPGYRLVRFLGEGGMGAVFLAQQLKLGREVAIKMIGAKHREDEGFILRLEREAQTLGQLDHPHVVACYDVGRHQSCAYIAMQYVPGALSAERAAKAFGGLPEDLAAEIVYQAALGLRYAWTKGIIHRDVKPDNLLLHQEQPVPLDDPRKVLDPEQLRVMIADFGLARKEIPSDTAPGITVDGAIVGSPTYMAPEQALAADPDHRSDIYSLGATFYTLLTGRPPFLGATVMETLHMALNSPLPDPRRLKPELSQVAIQIVTKMLAREPANRYQDYDALLAALNLLRPQASSATLVATRFPMPRRPWMVVAVAALVALAGVGAWTARRGPVAIQKLLPDSGGLGLWQGSASTWTMAPPDDESAALAMVGRGENGRIEYAVDLPPGVEIRLDGRVFAGATGALALWSPGAERFRLEWRTENGQTMYRGLVDGREAPVTPPGRKAGAQDWRRFVLRVYPRQVVLMIDGELARHALLAIPMSPFRLVLSVSGGGIAQYKDILLRPLPAEPALPN